MVTELPRLHQRAPELKLCLPDWPGEALKVAGLYGSDLRTLAWEIRV